MSLRCRYPTFREPISVASSFSRALRKSTTNFRQFSCPSEGVIFSGIQPTGVPHLGNYLGALKEWVDLQAKAQHKARLLFCVVDLHAITLYQEPWRLQQWKRETLAALLAVGLDPKRCTIFFQSSVWKLFQTLLRGLGT